MDATIRIGDTAIGRISPRLYGAFAEHLGRCCYGGLWVGPESSIANVDGFRRDVVEALRELPTPLIRWPGGCYADHHHWRNGIGARADRPVTLGMSCGVSSSDTNALGTHEFLRLCELLGAEPYLAGNVGTGSPQELCDWLEYVNCGVDTTLTRERAANGRAEAWGVRLWGVGNESWDCGGRYSPESYAAEYRRYASMLRQVDPAAELVAVGMEERPDDDTAWNARLLAALGAGVDLVDHLSIHTYWTHGGPETGFDEADYYALLDEAAGTERLVEQTVRTIAEHAGGRRIGIALDEWGVWHPEARDWGPGDVDRRRPATFEQANTMRDALAAAIALEGLHRQCVAVTVANLAQVVNVLQSVLVTDGEACIRTPTYHALSLHRPHVGAEALAVEVETDATLPAGGQAVSATASRTAAGIAVTVVNRHLRRPVTVRVPAGTGVSPDSVVATVLSADAADAVNTSADPHRVAPRRVACTVGPRGAVELELPACSMATLELAYP
jgi:alpha-L-arabinofuranosidase